MARRYQFYVRVAEKISFSVPQEHKIRIFIIWRPDKVYIADFFAISNKAASKLDKRGKY